MTCANCEHNDGMVYASMPPRYRCAITKELHLGNEACNVEFKPVKHGRWLKTGQSFIFPEKFRNYFCSECLFELDRKSIRTEYRYCPNCGAKMDGGENESC